jgi:hypothetical protein
MSSVMVRGTAQTDDKIATVASARQAPLPSPELRWSQTSSLENTILSHFQHVRLSCLSATKRCLRYRALRLRLDDAYAWGPLRKHRPRDLCFETHCVRREMQLAMHRKGILCGSPHG